MLHFSWLPRRIKQSSFSLLFSFFFPVENKFPKVKCSLFLFHLIGGYPIYSLVISFKYIECEILISLRLTSRFKNEKVL